MAECFLLLFMRYLFNVFIWNLKSHMGSVGGVWDGKARKSHSSSTAGTCDMESDCQTGNKRVFPGPFPAELQPACLPLFPLSLPLHEGFPFPSGGGPLLSAVSPPPFPCSLCPGLLCCTHKSLLESSILGSRRARVAPSSSWCGPHTVTLP